MVNGQQVWSAKRFIQVTEKLGPKSPVAAEFVLDTDPLTVRARGVWWELLAPSIAGGGKHGAPVIRCRGEVGPKRKSISGKKAFDIVNRCVCQLQYTVIYP
jgi:hypothetical protein